MALPLRSGGVAQLGEHLLCKQGVIGSNPFTSTTSLRMTVVSRSVGPMFCRRGEAKSSVLPCVLQGGVPLCRYARPGLSGAGLLLFFVRVNQVLVRLWTRAMPHGCKPVSGVPWSVPCLSDRMFCLSR